MDQWNRIEDPGKNTNRNSQLFFAKMSKYTLERQSLQQLVLRELNTYMFKNEFISLFLTLIKIQLQLDQDLKVDLKIGNCLRKM